MIRVKSLTKLYGGVRAVDDLTFTIEPGKVTGFLGPNGAGKSTTMRMMLGLDRPTAGTVAVNGRRYVDFPAPLREVGALLDAGAMHPGRTGRSHLRIAAQANGIPSSRVEGVLAQVGLESAAGRRIKSYSLGMRQRIGIAAALLGDPPVLLFDEPVNGLDLDGVRWIRALFRGCAEEGRTVLVSSHLMSEMQLIADRIIVIGRGRLITDAPTQDLLRGLGGQRVRVRCPDSGPLRRALTARGEVRRTGQDELEVTGLAASDVGDLAHSLGIPVHHLAEAEQSLEDAYLRLTEGQVDHHGHDRIPVGSGGPR